MSTAAASAQSSSGVLKTKRQTSNMEAVVATKRKSKASFTQTKQGDNKPTRIKHICKVCDRVCRTPSQLKVHIRVHSGEKPHMCKICDKLFSSKTHLAQHMRIHTGDKPYQCKVCDIIFLSFRQPYCTPCAFILGINLTSVKFVTNVSLNQVTLPDTWAFIQGINPTIVKCVINYFRG